MAQTTADKIREMRAERIRRLELGDADVEIARQRYLRKVEVWSVEADARWRSRESLYATLEEQSGRGGQWANEWRWCRA